MDYRKITKFAAITALSLGLSACAELTDGLILWRALIQVWPVREQGKLKTLCL